MGKIVSAIILPDAWIDRVLAKVHLADEIQQIAQARKDTEQRLKRLVQVYLDGLRTPEEYQREKRLLEDRIGSLVVPGVDAAKEAGQLLEDLPTLWDQANLGEWRKLLLTMLDAIYVDTIEEKSVAAITPKPALVPLFQIATTKEGSDVVLIQEKELPPVTEDPEATSPCLWWRRGRVELHVQHGLAAQVAASWQAVPLHQICSQGLQNGRKEADPPLPCRTNTQQPLLFCPITLARPDGSGRKRRLQR